MLPVGPATHGLALGEKKRKAEAARGTGDVIL